RGDAGRQAGPGGVRAGGEVGERDGGAPRRPPGPRGVFGPGRQGATGGGVYEGDELPVRGGAGGEGGAAEGAGDRGGTEVAGAVLWCQLFFFRFRAAGLFSGRSGRLAASSWRNNSRSLNRFFSGRA